MFLTLLDIQDGRAAAVADGPAGSRFCRAGDAEPSAPDGTFAVNDPKTTRGERLRVPYGTFMNAIHDLNAADYQAGKKAVLFTQQDGELDWFN